MRHIAISIVAALAWTDAAIVSARAETVNVYDDHGGSVADYDARWSELAARGANVRVVGPCQSACTVLLAHIPNDRICVTPQPHMSWWQSSGSFPGDQSPAVCPVSEVLSPLA